MVGLFQELGPCRVVEIDQGTLGTIAREWGWDRSSNMLFVDQPTQVGFSYDVLTNMSLNLLDETLSAPPSTVPASQPSYTFLNGTFGSGNQSATANTSSIAAQSMWHFLQGFLSTFPQYNPAVRSSGNFSGTVGINLFTESYGGRYGPAMASFFAQQNALRRQDPVLSNRTLEIELTSLGILNGWIDLAVQTPYFPRFAFNNTYRIQAISQIQQLNALNSWSGAGGCQQQTNACRALSLDDKANVSYANQVCSQAQTYCETNVVAPFYGSGRSVYDISQNALSPFPDSLYLDYLNQADVQQSIGVPVNYTQDSLTVYDSFLGTGDYSRGGILQDIVSLLEQGVRVALIYGDRDYICNWLGGEAASFAIAGAMGPAYLPWYSAGYAPIVTNDSYIGGVVREFGNLSFSRIYDAGHLVAAYQPETAFTVFSRVIKGTGVSLGQPVDRSNFVSYGDSNATHTNSAVDSASPACYLRAMNSTCNTDQKNVIANRGGVIINGVLYSQSSNWLPPAASISTIAGRPTVPPSSVLMSAPPSSSQSSSQTLSGGARSSTTIPTGVFTATGVPTSTSSSVAAATGIIHAEIFASPDGKTMTILAASFFSYGMMLFS